MFAPRFFPRRHFAPRYFGVGFGETGDGNPFVRFYLVDSPSSGFPAGCSWVALPAPISAFSGLYALVAVLGDNGVQSQVQATYPFPVGWSGTEAEARRLLRSKDLTHAWWLFDWFVASFG